jgi:hypothetical protein
LKKIFDWVYEDVFEVTSGSLIVVIITIAVIVVVQIVEAALAVTLGK